MQGTIQFGRRITYIGIQKQKQKYKKKKKKKKGLSRTIKRKGKFGRVIPSNKK
jgi:hypothetical protein